MKLRPMENVVLPNRYEFLLWLASLMILVITGCSTPGGSSSDETVTIFNGGAILTVDDDFSEVEAMAVQGSKILATGSFEEVRAAAPGEFTVVELEGRTMLPGFIDAHAHVLTGVMLEGLMEYVGVGRFSSTQEVLDYMKDYEQTLPPGEWLAASAWDPSIQAGPAVLTRDDLDEVSTERPVFVINASGHLAYANSKAFEVAGIDDSVVNPEGAEFVRDDEGRINGVMKNMAAFINVWTANPAVESFDFVENLYVLLDKWNSVGITTSSELALGVINGGPEDLNILLQAAESKEFSVRLRVYPSYIMEDVWRKSDVRFGTGNELVRVSGYKLVADGSNQGFTGLQREPYCCGNGSHGIAYTSPEDLYRLVTERIDEGWPLAIHGNGDQAIDNILDALNEAGRQGFDIASARPRIEHCSILHDAQITRMKELGVSASFLIGHVYYWGVDFRDNIFGEEKAQLLDRCRSVEEAGISYTLHSDYTVTEALPLQMIQTAVTRQTWKEPDFILAPQERISVESAIRALTSAAAWQLMSEHEVGSLEAGKFADFVILEEDPRQVDPFMIKDIRVIETWMNGDRVFLAESE